MIWIFNINIFGYLPTRQYTKVIFNILIFEESRIDASSQLGSRPEDLSGNIEFSNVEFCYPTRPSVPVWRT